MHFHALALLAEINEVHGALRDGDVEKAIRIGGAFDEDRELLQLLTEGPTAAGAAFVEPTDALRRSLARLRDSAATELLATRNASVEQDRARLTVRTCDSILGSR